MVKTGRDIHSDVLLSLVDEGGAELRATVWTSTSGEQGEARVICGKFLTLYMKF